MDIRDLFKYNWFSRHRFLKSMVEISWEKIVESCGASFDCIRDIFVHSLQAEQFWIKRLTGKSTEGIFDTPFSRYADVNSIQEYAAKVESETNRYMETLTDDKLHGLFEYKGWDGKLNRHRVEDILMHVIEEEIHHRGELLCIYWQHDIQPPYTSYTSYKSQA